MGPAMPPEDALPARRLPSARFRSVSWRMLRILVAHVVAAGLAGAAEGVLADLRLVTEIRPTAFSYRWEPSGAGVRTGEDSCANSWAVGSGLRWGFGNPGSQHQLLVGSEVLLVHDEYLDGGSQAGVLRAEVGYALAIDERWQVLASVVGGGGPGGFTRPGGTSGGGTMRGQRSELGLHLGARWAATRRWAIGGEVGWLESRELYRDDDGRLELTRGGGWFGLAVSWVLDTSPRRIDR